MSPEVAYLCARYDEEEADARAVPQYNGDEQWVLDPQYDHYDHTRVLWISPAHVLADIAAKRAIVQEYVRELTDAHQRQRAGMMPGYAGAILKRVVLALLQPYAGRPDFDRSWAL